MATLMANYTSGFANGVSIRGLPVLQTHPGRVIWLSNTSTILTGQRSGSNSGKGTFDAPYSTLTYAISQCVANRGDLIIVKPGHAETITGVGGLTFNVAGMAVLGLGRGTTRPRFLMDGGTTVTGAISAANVTLSNLVFAGGHNGIVTCLDVTAANAQLHSIEFEDNTTDEHFLVAISASGADNSADGLTVENCRWVTIDTGVTDFVSLTGTVNRLTMRNNYFCADGATGAGMLLCATGKVLTGLDFCYNTLICGNTATDLLIDNDATTNTGVAAWNMCGHHDTAAAILIDADGIRMFENYSTSSDTEHGVLHPAADTTT